MKNKQAVSGFVSVLIVTIFVLVIGFLVYKRYSPIPPAANMKQQTPTPQPSIFPYKQPVINKNDSYRIILVGDSMTASLGINANPLRLALIENYPDNEFVTYNYSIPSTNILSVPERLTQGNSYLGQPLPPILNQGYDLIIIESFAYNPLSEFSLEEGLQKQSDVFVEVISKLILDRPDSVIIMMNMIAPDAETFASMSRELSQEQRDQWISERIAYMDNAKKFASEKNIPFIDIYANSLDEDGFAVSDYISEDTIHPSDEGREFIAETIADYIYENEILPHQ